MSSCRAFPTHGIFQSSENPSGVPTYKIQKFNQGYVLNGGFGDDVLISGTGNDYLTGSMGDDTFILKRGTGQDVIYDQAQYEFQQDNDVLLFDDQSVNYDQLWFAQSGDNLEISIIGTTDKVEVASWFAGGYIEKPLAEIQAGGQLLTSVQVQLLVDAMAAFGSLPTGTTLSGSERTALNTQIATLTANPIATIDSYWAA